MYGQTPEGGNLLLEQLADIVEQSKSYDQSHYFDAGGEPACALGHWLHHRGFNERRLPQPFDFAKREFSLTEVEAERLFGGAGCGDARRSGARAAAFIRSFVAARRACRSGRGAEGKRKVGSMHPVTQAKWLNFTVYDEYVRVTSEDVVSA